MSVQVKGSGTIGGLDEGLVVSGIVTSSTQVNVGSNIKLGNAGVVTATTFSGSGASLTNLPAANLTGTLPAISGANLTGITQTTINNNANNRVITGSGTANTLEAESNLNFDNTNSRFTIGSANSMNATDYGTAKINGSAGGVVAFSVGDTQKWEVYGNAAQLQIYDRANTKYNTKFKAGGNVEITDGNLVLASGHGIDFSATANAGGASQTTSSELFDDYEEGSWTPVIAASAANPSFTFASGFPRGRYRKIGEQVTLWYDIAWSGLPSQGGGTLQMQNFPYSTGSSLYHGAGLMSHTVGTNAGGAYTGKHTHYANPNSSFMYILSGASTNGHMQCTALNSSGHIFGFFTFAT